MKNLLRPLLALSLALVTGTYAYGAFPQVNTSGIPNVPGDPIYYNVEYGADNWYVPSNYGNDSIGSQLSYDSFANTVSKRLDAIRIGSIGSFGPTGGAYNRPPANYGPPPSNYPPPTYNNPGYSGSAYPTGNPYQGGGNPYQQAYPQSYQQPYPQQTYPQQGYQQAYPQQQYQGATYGNEFNTGYNNGYSSTFASDEAFAAPVYGRTSASYARRQLDCVYYSGFTVWADLYQTWASQSADGPLWDGYKYDTFGPSIGFDWTSGPLTLGLATTYNWGKMKGRNFYHDRKLRTFGIMAYGQYNSDNWYLKGSLGYGHNSFKSTRGNTYNYVTNYSQNIVSNTDSYNSNAFNIDAEFGMKFNWSSIALSPYVGVRYFHDRRGGIDERTIGAVNALVEGGRGYHTLELPIGIKASHSFNLGNGMRITPMGGFAWVPQLSRSGGGASGFISNPTASTYQPGSTVPYADGSPYAWNTRNRARSGFKLDLGLQADITKSISANISYTGNFRSHAREHMWELGMGFTF